MSAQALKKTGTELSQSSQQRRQESGVTLGQVGPVHMFSGLSGQKSHVAGLEEIDKFLMEEQDESPSNQAFQKTVDVKTAPLSIPI